MSKSRTHWLVLYPDDSTHVDAMGKLDTDCYRYSAILHDKDISEDGYKKPHWNVIVKFSSPRSADSVAFELGILPNYIKYCGNTKSAERYHIHLDNPERGTYDICEVFGTDRDSVVKSCIDKADEADEVRAIIYLLNSYTCHVKTTDFLMAVCDHGLYATFRRMGSLASSLLFEHNQKYSKEGEKK